MCERRAWIAAPRPSPWPATKSSMAGWLCMAGLGGYLLAALDNLFKRMTGNERLL
jgi:hypothetical protein